MYKILAFASIVIGCAFVAKAQPISPAFGVNEAGLEMGSGSRAWYNYAVPDPTYMLKQGVAIIRVPFTLERLQPVPFSALNQNYLGYITSIVQQNATSNVMTVLDIHNYGYISNDGTSREIGVDPVGTAEYLDEVTKLAAAVRGQPLVAIGLMNEPHVQTCAQLAQVWQSAINVIRGAGFDGQITVPPTNWSHADTFVSSGCAGLFEQLLDPEQNLVFEIHNYLDPYQSGTYRQPIASPNVGTQQLEDAIAWAKKYSMKLYVGETGTPSDPASIAALNNELTTISANPGQFWGVTLWAASPWWPVTYNLRLDPVNGVPQPQMVLLQNFLSPPPAALVVDLTKGNIQQNTPYSISIDGLPFATEATNTATLIGQISSGKHIATVTLQTSNVGNGSVGLPNGTVYFVSSTLNGHAVRVSNRKLSRLQPTTYITFTKD